VALYRPQNTSEYLIVGLGNPGPTYEGTRHNVGYQVVELLARRHGFPKAKRGFDGRCAEGAVGGRPVFLLQPTTFMNDSGRSVAAALRALKLPLERVLVVHDHIDLPFGRLRLVAGGGSGGNNGVKSVTSLIGSEYARLRVGVDRPASYDPDIVADWVLSRFPESKQDVEGLVAASADAVELWLELGLQDAAARVNGLGR
jgi:peptidyl-tRNA hydrolase, PTH1 family